MRAAMVGGTAYYAGKRMQQGSQREGDQEARLEALEQQQYAAPPPQQYAPPPPPAPAPGGITDDTIAQLERLGELQRNGILTEEEFAEQKRKLLQG
jgi:hypothetical protein